MSFDISTAKPVSSGFDINTAKLVSDNGEIMSRASGRELKAKNRGNAFEWLGAIKKGTEEKPKDFLGNVGRGMQIPLALMTGTANVGESALSDIVLGVTEKKPGAILPHLAETFTGKRSSKFSDVAESVGVPEGLPSSTAGFLTAFGLTDIAAGGQMTKALLSGGRKVIGAAGQGINKVIETTKDGFQTLKGLKLPTTATLEKNILIENISGQKRELILGEQATRARYNLNKLLDEARRKGASQEELVSIKQGVARQAEEKARYNLAELKDTTTQIFKRNKQALEDKFGDMTESKILEVQKALPEYFNSNFKTYGTWQDEVADNLVIRRGNITLEEANNILRKTIEDATEESKNFGDAFNKIYDLWSNKYKTTTSNLNKPIKLQELKADLSSVFKTVNYGKYGKSEDQAAHILRKNWGDFIVDATKNEAGVSEYAEMQNWYSQNVDAMKMADKIFKPKGGELESEKGVEFLKKFGLTKKPPLARRELISQIETGSEKVKGIGGVTKELTDLGEEIRNLESSYEASQVNISGRIRKLGSEASRHQYELAQELKQVKQAGEIAVRKIAQRIDDLDLRSTLVKNNVKKEMKDRIGELSIKLANRKKAVALARMLGLGVGGVVGAYQGAKVINNIFGFRESYGQ